MGFCKGIPSWSGSRRYSFLSSVNRYSTTSRLTYPPAWLPCPNRQLCPQIVSHNIPALSLLFAKVMRKVINMYIFVLCLFHYSLLSPILLLDSLSYLDICLTCNSKHATHFLYWFVDGHVKMILYFDYYDQCSNKQERADIQILYMGNTYSHTHMLSSR